MWGLGLVIPSSLNILANIVEVQGLPAPFFLFMLLWQEEQATKPMYWGFLEVTVYHRAATADGERPNSEATTMKHFDRFCGKALTWAKSLLSSASVQYFLLAIILTYRDCFIVISLYGLLPILAKPLSIASKAYSF